MELNGGSTPNSINHSHFIKYTIPNATFDGLNGERISFDLHGDLMDGGFKLFLVHGSGDGGYGGNDGGRDGKRITSVYRISSRVSVY